MTEAWNTFVAFWPEWLQDDLLWMFIGIAVLFLLLGSVWLIRRVHLKRRLPHKSARKEWASFKKHHIPRTFRASEDLQLRTAKGLIQLFRKHIDQELGQYLVLLAPMAAGKTWALYEVMLHLHRQYRRVWMLSMNQEDPLSRIADISRKEDTWLIIDDLDAFYPELQARERINLLLEATAGFKAVVLAVQPERWPDIWSRPDQLGRIKIVGEDHFSWGISAHLVDWNQDQAISWLYKFAAGSNIKGIQRVIDGIDWRNQMWHRPVMLKLIIQSAGIGGPSRYVADVIDKAIQKAIGSQGDSNLWEVMLKMATGQKEGLPDLSSKNLRALFMTHSDGAQRFRFRMLEGFFLARHAINRTDKAIFRELFTHPEARLLYLEKTWSRFLDEGGINPGCVRLPGTPSSIQLRTLSVDQLTEVAYLELESAALPHLQFLRLMPSLRRIWVRNGREEDLNHITEHWKARHGAIVWMDDHEGNRIGWERIQRFDEPSRWDRLEDFGHVHPALESQTKVIRGVSHPFRQIFRLDPDKLPNPICQKVDIPLHDHRGLEEVRELNLGAGEFELFDKVYIYQFENGDIHLQYLHSRPSANLIPILREILDRWITFIGPDDQGRRELEEEEIMDIQQGSWVGRVWMNLHPAEFDRQALLQMTRPGFIEIWIRNGKPQHASIS